MSEFDGSIGNAYTCDEHIRSLDPFSFSPPYPWHRGQVTLAPANLWDSMFCRLGGSPKEAGFLQSRLRLGLSGTRLRGRPGCACEHHHCVLIGIMWKGPCWATLPGRCGREGAYARNPYGKPCGIVVNHGIARNSWNLPNAWISASPLL